MRRLGRICIGRSQSRRTRYVLDIGIFVQGFFKLFNIDTYALESQRFICFNCWHTLKLHHMQFRIEEYSSIAFDPLLEINQRLVEQNVYTLISIVQKQIVTYYRMIRWSFYRLSLAFQVLNRGYFF